MGSRENIDDFRPWKDEDEKSKRGSKPKGVPAKTAINSKVPSIPNVKSQEYLNIFIMQKEKERLEQYGELLSDKHEKIIKDWKTLKEKIMKLKENLTNISGEELRTEGKKKADSQKKPRERKIPGNLKKMDWNY